MKYIKGTVTSDYKNNRTLKKYSFDMFGAFYHSNNNYKIFIDRDDDRRQILIFSPEEFKEFKSFINNI